MNKINRKYTVFTLLGLLALSASSIKAQDADTTRPSVNVNEQFGSLNYQVPFPQLPARAGVEPDLSLSYSQIPGDSGQGFGLAWSVHVPSITILNETHLRSHGFNESMHEVSFDTRFRLAWDGTELSFINFDDENALVEYSLEKSGEKLRILRHFYPFDVEYLGKNGQKLSRTFNSGFEILHPDGRRQYYSGDLDVAEGREVDSNDPDVDPVILKTFVSRWPLVLEVHPGGEAIQYSYIKDQGRSFLDRVSFAGGYSFYQMNWILRSSGPESMVYGFPQQSRLLYTGMAACFKDKALRTWRFDYGTDLPKDLPDASCDQDAASLHFEAAPEGLIEETWAGLKQMTGELTSWANRAITATLGEKTYPTPAIPHLAQLHRLGQKPESGGAVLHEPRLDFQYTASRELTTQPVLFEAPTPAGSTGFGLSGNTEMMDVNRDGLLDLVKYDGRASQVWFNEGRGYDAQNFVRSKPFAIKRITNGQDLVISPALNEGLGQALFIRGDLDGDGWLDLMEIKADGTPLAYLRSTDAAETFIASERSLQELTDDGERALNIVPEQIKQGRGMLIDVTGDGKDDLLSVKQNSQGRLEWSVLINETPRSSSFVRFRRQAYTFPFSSSDQTILEGAELRFLDMNRDGLVDLVRPAIVGGEYGICVYNNLGKAGFPNQGDRPLFDGSVGTESCRPDQFRKLQNLEKPDRTHMMQMWVLDINGDGAEDFADLSQDGRTLYYWLANAGQSSFQERRSLELFPDGQPNDRLSIDPNNKSNAITLDFDQDGQDELVIYQPADGKVKVIDFNRLAGEQQPPAGLLYAVESEDGGLDQFVYTSHVQELLQERTAHPETAQTVSSIPYHETLLKQWIHRSSQGFLNGNDDRQSETFSYAKAIWDGSMASWLGYAEVSRDKPGAFFNGQSIPAQRTVNTYPFLPEDLETQRYLSASLESTAIYESPWTEAQETQYGQYLAALARHPSNQVYRSQVLPQFKGPTRLLQAETYVPDLKVLTFTGAGATSNSRSHALINVGSVETRFCGDDDEGCESPRLEQSTYEYDDKRRLVRTSNSQAAVDGPANHSLKSRTFTSEYVYDAASEDLGILLNPATVTTRRGNGSVIELVERKFHPILGKVIKEVTSGSMQKSGSVLPASLQGKVAGNTLKQSETFDYDIFGNQISASDSIGTLNLLSYDRDGLLLLKSTNANNDARYYCYSREYCLSQEFALPADVDLPETIGTMQFVRDENGAYTLTSSDSIGRIESLRRSSGSLETRSYSPYAKDAPNLFQLTRTLGTSAQDVERELVYFDSDERELMRMKEVNEARVELISARIWNRLGQPVYDLPTIQFDASLASMGDFSKAGSWLLNQKGGTTSGFDSLGREKIEVQAGDKETVKTQYTAWGWMETRQGRDAEPKSISVLGRDENAVEAVIDETGMVQEFERDEQGSITRVRLADESQVREYGFDSRGLPVFVKVPGLVARVWNYDARGRLTQTFTSDAQGKKPIIGLRYDYDALDRLIQVSDSSGVSPRSLKTFSYAKTYLLRAGSSNPQLNQEESIAYVRDAEGRILSSRHEYRRPDGTIQAAFDESYRYRLDGKILERRSGNGVPVSYGYDALGEVSRITADGQVLFELESYDAIGKVSRGRFANGSFSVVHSFDPLDRRLTRSSVCRQGCREMLSDMELQYDSADQLIARVDLDGEGLDVSAQFGYSPRNEVLNAGYANQELSWEYTPGGNMQKNSLESTTPLLAQTASPLLPRAASSRTATFDDWGRLRSWSGVKQSEWNVFNQIVSLDTNEGLLQFGQGPFGERTTKSQKKGETIQTTYFPYPGLTAGSGTSTSIQLPMGVWAHFDHQRQSLSYGIEDERGITSLRVSATGEKEGERRSDPFGRILEESKNGLFSESSAEIFFSGLRRDRETGWIDFGNRMFLPELAAFSSFDEGALADPESCAGGAWQTCGLYR